MNQQETIIETPVQPLETAINAASELDRGPSIEHMWEVFRIWEGLDDDVDKFQFLETLPIMDQLNIARSRRSEDKEVPGIWGSLEKCYQWALKTEIRLHYNEIKGDSLEEKLRNELEELYANDIPYKQYFMLFEDEHNTHQLGCLLGQLVYWSTRGARFMRDGKFWKTDEELSLETLTSVRTIENNRRRLHEFGYIEWYGRHCVGGISTMHYKLDEEKIYFDFKQKLDKYMNRRALYRDTKRGDYDL
jgi:hypothetical protein